LVSNHARFPSPGEPADATAQTEALIFESPLRHEAHLVVLGAFVGWMNGFLHREHRGRKRWAHFAQYPPWPRAATVLWHAAHIAGDRAALLVPPRFGPFSRPVDALGRDTVW